MAQELKAQDKKPVQTEAEQTRTCPLFVPPVDIFESEEGMTLLADMPGVTKEKLSIDLKDNTLTIRGMVKSPEEEGVKFLIREYECGDFYRQFTLSEMIDQEKITATLSDGVLTLFLPKMEPVQPRRIEIQVK